MAEELGTLYEPAAVEGQASELWEREHCFDAEAPREGQAKGQSYTIVIPPPNVTAALHLGHALNNTLQDILVRWRRMQGRNALWMPGTDHAGIATQTVVEKRILAEEGKRRTEFAREEFVGRVQAWKDEYEARIVGQLEVMGCSCDWRRTRFTMDEVCARAVRGAFFKLFADGLIYRGKRLVNWDPATQTVLADDEVEHETVEGHFWYMRYPLVEAVRVPGGGGAESLKKYGAEPSEDGQGHEAVEKRSGRYLPHWTQEGATYAITFRLADSVPADVAQSWRDARQAIFDRAAQEKRELTDNERNKLQTLFSERIESYLDAGHGCCFLKDARVAKTVQDAFRHFDGERYKLVAWVVMPNHVHVIIRPLNRHKLESIVHSWKSFTAKAVNSVLDRTGQVWMEEYYDHLIRNEEDYWHQVNYVTANAEKGGLVEWPWQGRIEDFRGQDARDTERGQDARDTERGQDARDTIIEYVTVATTRPETMLGDTAVAMHPGDPRAAALVGKKVRLPIAGREIPIVADEHVVLPDAESEDEKARFSTGFLKVTPAHDPNDWEIGQRHGLDVINVMAPDGTISDKYGWEDCSEDAQFLLGMDRFEAREAIVEWFRQEQLLAEVRPYAHEVGHSYRSHVPIEPYLSDQWYVAVKKTVGQEVREERGQDARDTERGQDARDTQRGQDARDTERGQDARDTERGQDARDTERGQDARDTKGGDALATNIEGTDVPVNSLAGLALKPLLDGRLRFVPERYAKTYQGWLENLRDWPISRQLWWGHQIPVWSKAGRQANYSEEGTCCRVMETEQGPVSYLCVQGGFEELETAIEADGWVRDADVLDTWFSSALWPFSTMGWPEATGELAAFYPGNVLCTAREIITLWVSRMVMMGQYCVGDIPFSDVFIHAMIQDGDGRKMSKSLGNGIDPLDIIESHGADAMRFTLASMTTQTQDVRLPVEAMKLPDGRTLNSSPKFDLGRSFCNKLWNASRFALMNLEGVRGGKEGEGGEYFRGQDARDTERGQDARNTERGQDARNTERGQDGRDTERGQDGRDTQGLDGLATMPLEDRWILSRLARAVEVTTGQLEEFKFSEPMNGLYRFFWNDFCDWYLELIKPRMRDESLRGGAQRVLAFVLDEALRLLHPFVPFITEAIYQKLREVCPERGLAGVGEAADSSALAQAAWPGGMGGLVDEEAEGQMEVVQQTVRAIREVRTRYQVGPRKGLEASAKASAGRCALLAEQGHLIRHLASLERLEVSEGAVKPDDAAVAIADEIEIYVHGLIDVAQERARLEGQKEQLAAALGRCEGKLANENFVNRAKAEVVARERERLVQLQEQMGTVEANLAKLPGG